jgi:hypothetical protein
MELMEKRRSIWANREQGKEQETGINSSIKKAT